jgi:hypothetical protein
MSRFVAVVGILILSMLPAFAANESTGEVFPRPLTDYQDVPGGILDVLKHRAEVDPFNLVATGIFLLAIVHTFLTARIRHWAHEIEERHRVALVARLTAAGPGAEVSTDEVSFWGQILHFFGEVEAVFGIWALVLGVAIAAAKGFDAAVHYIGETVNYTEPMFVVIIMALASTRPVLQLAENSLRVVANLGGGRPWAWWLSILTIAPIMGSFITEPAAMTIAALLLGRQFFEVSPSSRLRYATIGLLFVNISIGGTLTHFAAPPVLMVAAPWGWDIAYMFTHFGWHAITGIALANAVYFLIFRRELMALRSASEGGVRETPAPFWVTTVHFLFLAFTVWMAHYPALVMGGFLFFVAFSQATAQHQNRVELRGPILVGFFLAGLVQHGGLQGWWIEPVLSRLSEVPLFTGAMILTAFNDNALITYLATLVPNFSEELKLAVVSGAVTGGGLTVIANAPNPAGQSILQKYFPGGVSPVKLLFGALLPTLIVAISFMLL